MLRILGSDAAMHDAVAGREGDFDRVAGEIRAARARGEDPSLAIGLDRRNFFALDEMVRTACRLAGKEPPVLDGGYDVRPVGRIHTNLTRHLKRLLPFQYQSGIEIEFTDPDLAAILRGIERVAGPTNEGDLLRLLGVFAGRTFIGPKRLLIDPLYACNLDCTYCNNFSAPRKEAVRARLAEDPLWRDRDKMLSFDLFERTITEAREMGVEAVSIVGGGEPLLHPRFAEMVEMACRAGFQVDFSTNGLALTPALAERVIRARPDSVTISIAAASEATYQALHPAQPAGTYARVMENARRLAGLRAQGGEPRPRLIALHVLCNANFREAEAMVREAKGSGLDEVWLQLIHVRDFCRELALSGPEIGECRERVARARALAGELGLGFSDYVDFQLDHLRPDGTWSAGPFVERGCLVGWTFSILTCGGDVSFCCGWKFVASARETGFRAVWESPEYDELRRSARVLGRGASPVLANGKRLFDDFCLSCDNHNLNREMFQMLADYDLLRYLDAEASG